jgi:hypothetical protein
MPTKDELRKVLKDKLPQVIAKVNEALAGVDVESLEPVLTRIGRGQELPHWYAGLLANQTLPNLDGKTVGSVIEMLLVAVLETHFFAAINGPRLRINPARGVDLPDLDLGIKSPSENYCTSERFFSVYERLIGSDHDVLVFLTDYQEAKRKTPFRLQIKSHRFLDKSQIADKSLCRIAKKHRDSLVREDESRAKRVFRFLAYVNQSDWRAKRLLRIVDLMDDEADVRIEIETFAKEFAKTNKTRLRKDEIPIPDEELEALQKILAISPIRIGVADAVDNWVAVSQKETARIPSDFEWKRILSSPLDGQIGMSLALQWRYNFGQLFGMSTD